MNQHIADLLARYTRAINAKGSAPGELVEGYNTLRLADAALDKQALNNDHPNHPLQVVIVGPTQAGKSTLCNLLLDTNAAGISALAGYTMHAQGFAVNIDNTQLSILEDLMLPLQRVPLTQLSSDSLNQYVLEPVHTGSDAMVDDAVVWDSPDFDSIEASGYRGSVLQAVAMADILVLMVSKDKYADKTVWDMLKIIRQLGKPLFVCINKLDEKDRYTVIDSFKRRHVEQFNSDAPEIVALPFVRKPGESITNSQAASASANNQSATSHQTADDTITIDTVTRNEFISTFRNTQSKVTRNDQSQHIDNFIKNQWPLWMAPIEREQDALLNWTRAVNLAMDDSKDRYASRYLNNPNKYETFNKAIAELLTLLEIPGLATALSKTRNVVTWPARKLLGIGRSITQGETQVANQELDVLDLILDQTMTSLQGHILVAQQDADANQPFWPGLQKAMSEQKNTIRSDYTARAAQLQTEFEPRIEKAAQQLYGQLQDQPALLNTLRAARVTTDAAAVVLAVKSGGLAAADLVIAPAMLSVTTLLTESVLGQYMDISKQQLQQEQQALIDEQLIERELGDKLLKLSQALDSEHSLLSGYGPLPELSVNKSLN